MTTNTNSSTPGGAFVFYVAQNGSAACLSVSPDSSGGIVANPGPRLPSALQGGHVLALAAGDSSGGSQLTPQVGVLTSNGTVYYELFFSFFTNGAWSSPERKPPLPPVSPLPLQTPHIRTPPANIPSPNQSKPSSSPPFPP